MRSLRSMSHAGTPLLGQCPLTEMLLFAAAQCKLLHTLWLACLGRTDSCLQPHAWVGQPMQVQLMDHTSACLALAQGKAVSSTVHLRCHLHVSRQLSLLVPML